MSCRLKFPWVKLPRGTLRSQAFNILSLRLWAAPAEEWDSWLEVLTLLEMIK